jgi:hypothetical protein
VFAAVAWFPVRVAVHFARVALARDTHEQAADWLRANVAPSARVLIGPGLVLPLPYSAGSLEAAFQDQAGVTRPWIVHQVRTLATSGEIVRYSLHLFPALLARNATADPPAIERHLDALAPQYAVLERSLLLTAWPMVECLHAAVAARGELVFRSRGQVPDGEARGLLNYQDADDLALRILDTQAFGSELSIYRIVR